MSNETKHFTEEEEKIEQKNKSREEQIKKMVNLLFLSAYVAPKYEKIMELKEKVGLSEEEFFDSIRERAIDEADKDIDPIGTMIAIKKGLSLSENFFRNPETQKGLREMVAYRCLCRGHIEKVKKAKEEFYLSEDNFKQAIIEAIEYASKYPEFRGNVEKIKEAFSIE